MLSQVLIKRTLILWESHLLLGSPLLIQSGLTQLLMFCQILYPHHLPHFAKLSNKVFPYILISLIAFMAYPYQTKIQPQAASMVPTTSALYQPFGSAHENSATIVQPETDEKYKTELCKNWVQYGHCSYGSKCRFAHGQEDLVNKQIYNPKYKSKKCEGFHTTFYCPYGGRCNFIHDDGTAYKQRLLYYTYLLDFQTKSTVIKHIFMKYLEEAFAAYAKTGASHNNLLENFIEYIKNREYLRRLPVFVQIATQESEPEEAAEWKGFLSIRVKAILKELFGKFMYDYTIYKDEEEYWETLKVFLTVLIALHPDLKEMNPLEPKKQGWIKMLENMYEVLVVKPAEQLKGWEEEGMIGDWMEEIIMKESYEDTETAPDEELGPSVDVFSVKWTCTQLNKGFWLMYCYTSYHI
eukprot:TRINITY_DN1497_c0_g2_i1.p1 TRINITY_DN1497_c0_g2~~TRINITY_DN1497_c0_g2_i1.p1  ORF type:complete len:409 (-),score=30.46 TRINITY_DN1497_c0_g2_i1:105-1331(-)